MWVKQAGTGSLAGPLKRSSHLLGPSLTKCGDLSGCNKNFHKGLDNFPGSPGGGWLLMGKLLAHPAKAAGPGSSRYGRKLRHPTGS